MSTLAETLEIPGTSHEVDAPVLRHSIQALEDTMLEMPQLAIEPVHYFAKGLYAREITIPAGTVLSGKIHKEEQINILSKGLITVVTEDGGEQLLRAPCTIVSKPGTKRIAYVHEETVWTTIHATDETDLEKLEQDLIAPSFEALEQCGTGIIGGDQPWLG